jgi:hypothetical protein
MHAVGLYADADTDAKNVYLSEELSSEDRQRFPVLTGPMRW